MSVYLCYDLKGIQQYVFQVPKLKCIIGGSRQIDGFDRDFAARIAPAEYVFSGGGKGAFRCENETRAAVLESLLREHAAEMALTICFSSSPDYSVAATEHQRTYNFIPGDLSGQPCAMSGLYPTNSPDGIHPAVRAKMQCGRPGNSLENRFLQRLKEDLHADFDFIADVDPDSAEGRAGAAALGNRNRWAVICMDGNDMGEQFRVFKASSPSDSQWREWLPKMSCALDQCTCDAAYAGIRLVAEKVLAQSPQHSPVLLPIRPLIVGGDDVTMLVHCDYAFPMVETIMREFKANSQKQEPDCFPGTGGALTISAGVLFAPVGLPLAMAINYTESLLASAKGCGRKAKLPGAPAPASVDWESVTEGLLDSPHARRQREFVFYDEAVSKKIFLTRRPYLLDDFIELRELAKKYADIPHTIRYQIHRNLLQGFDDRLAFYARIRKNYPGLYRDIVEIPGKAPGAQWIVDGGEQKTSVVDALLLEEEASRMQSDTVNFR